MIVFLHIRGLGGGRGFFTWYIIILLNMTYPNAKMSPTKNKK